MCGATSVILNEMLHSDAVEMHIISGRASAVLGCVIVHVAICHALYPKSHCTIPAGFDSRWVDNACCYLRCLDYIPCLLSSITTSWNVYNCICLSVMACRYLIRAKALVNDVHDTLGKTRDGKRRLGDATDDHPTRAGLRIGKPYPEGRLGSCLKLCLKGK